LAAGDLGGYQDAVDELGRVLERIAELTGVGPLPSAEPSSAP
jgi:hypothetical protein